MQSPIRVIILASLLASPAWAQTTPKRSPAAKPPASQPAKQPAKPAMADDTPAAPAAKTPASGEPKPVASPSPVEFAEEPLKLESIGLTMPMPVGCLGQIDTAGQEVSARIAPKDASWSIRVAAPKGAADMTTSQVADAAIVTLLESYGITDKEFRVLGTRGRLIAREPQEGQPPLNINGLPADRWYVALPALEGKAPLARGFTVLRTAPGHFITFELLTTEAALEKTRGMFQTLIAASTITDPVKLAADRAGAVAAGLNLFENLGEKAMREIIAERPERWERLYKPSPTGSASDEIEIAYRRIRCKVGTRADVSNEKGARAAGGATEGFIVQIDARLIDSGGTVDSRASYFMTPDRSEESWVVQNAFRNPKSDPSVFTETGARTGKSMVVRIDGTGKPPQTIKPVLQDEGYITQVEAALLPYLLIRHGVSAEHGFYVYQSQANTVRMRRDFVDQPPDAPNFWKITTRLSEDKKPQISIYNDQGRLVRIEQPDGSRWEPTTLEDLVRLWKSKNSP